MSFRNLMPMASAHLSLHQIGSVSFETDNSALNSHPLNWDNPLGGHNDYLEIIAGDECINASGDWEAGRVEEGLICFPRVKYFTSISNFSRDVISNIMIDAEVMAKGYEQDNLARFTGAYLPGAGAITSYFFRQVYGDIIFGKFSRIAVYKTASSSQRHRFSIGLGEDNPIDEKNIQWN